MRQITNESKQRLHLLCSQYGVASNIREVSEDGSVLTNDVTESKFLGLVKSYKRIDFFDAITTIGNRILSQSSGDDQVSKTKKSIAEGCLKGIASDDPNRVICKLMSASTLIELPKEEKRGPSEEERKAAEEKKKQQEAEKQKKAEEQKKQQEEAKKKKEEEQKKKEEEQKQRQQNAQQNGNNKELVPVYRIVQENGETIREVEKIPMNDFMELVKANLKAGRSVEFT